MNGLQKFYLGLWAVFGLTILALIVTGNMTMLAFTVLGFVAFGIIFMGMICVLPTTVTHPGTPGSANFARERIAKATGWFKGPWSHPIAVEVKQPRLH